MWSVPYCFNFSLDSLRKLFTVISNERLGGFDSGALRIDYDSDLDSALSDALDLLFKNIILLERGGKDDLAIQAALMMIRTHAISLSSFFDAMADDAEFFLLNGNWAKIPDDYVPPE